VAGPAGGAYSIPPDPLAALAKGRKGEKKGWEGEWSGRDRE